MAKDFSGIDTANHSGMMQDIATATATKGQQGIATPQEMEERAAQMRTQGRKGCKLPRINLAFSPENHEYVKIMARCSGLSMTELVNVIIEESRIENAEEYQRAKSAQFMGIKRHSR